ncbi:MAG: hypothetical protein R3B45_14675 [Bdellovibrionota bacterium]
MLNSSFLGRVDVSFPTTSQTLESQRCQGFKNYPQCTSSTPPVIFETLPSCDFQVFVSRYENETSTRPSQRYFNNFRRAVVLCFIKFG